MSAPVETSSAPASSVPSVSARRVRANRRNARKSTGPRTEEGKAASARNATTHGAFCVDLLLPGGDAEELLSLKRGLESTLSPTDAMEHELVDRIVATQWRLRRLRGAERASLLRTQPPETPTSARAALDRAMCLAQATADRFREYGWDPALAKAEIAAVAEEDAKVPSEPVPAERLAKEFGCYGTGTLDRLSRYQQRLEQSVHRAMRELRQWRKDKRELGDVPPCPHLDEMKELDADADADEPDANADAGDDVAGKDTANKAAAVKERCPDLPSSSIVQNEAIVRSPHVVADRTSGCHHLSDDRPTGENGKCAGTRHRVDK